MVRGKVRKAPPTCTYVGTIYWTFYFDVEKLGFIRSKFFKEQKFDDVLFCLQAVTSSDTTITIELLRVLMKPDNRPDNGFFLEAYITLLGSRTATMCRSMCCDIDYVSVVYNIDYLKSAGNTSKCWSVKCVIKMKELTTLENDQSKQQNNLISAIISTHRFKKNFDAQKEDLLFLLQSPLSKIFTGRQTCKFAINKCIFIERTLCAARIIAQKHRAEQMTDISYDKITYQDIYLTFIYCGKLAKRFLINQWTAAELYISAHYYGLEFLQVECTEFMLRKLENEKMSVLDVLLVADLVHDHYLFDIALKQFMKHRKRIRATTQWNNLSYHYEPFAHSIIDSLIRKINTGEMPQSTSDVTQGTKTDKNFKTSSTSAGKISEAPGTSTVKLSETPEMPQSTSDVTEGTKTDKNFKTSSTSAEMSQSTSDVTQGTKTDKNLKTSSTSAGKISEAPDTSTVKLSETPGTSSNKSDQSKSTEKESEKSGRKHPKKRRGKGRK